MENLKPFDPQDIDESLTRIVVYDNHIHLLFPYISATGPSPKFESIGCVIGARAATVADFAALSALLRRARTDAEWFISFNTPWLLRLSDADRIRHRPLIRRPAR